MYIWEIIWKSSIDEKTQIIIGKNIGEVIATSLSDFEFQGIRDRKYDKLQISSIIRGKAVNAVAIGK